MVQLNDQKLNRQESSQNTIYHSNTPNGIDMQNKSLIDQNTFVLKHASQDIEAQDWHCTAWEAGTAVLGGGKQVDWRNQVPLHHPREDGPYCLSSNGTGAWDQRGTQGQRTVNPWSN